MLLNWFLVLKTKIL